MVKEERRENETFYICEECGLAYKERSWAERCEEFCSKYRSCSLEITKHAIQMK
ncbi:hypothetical protein KEJ25_02765 [Candidatus Bathyarchaeota archaeon]|nr:hypothetical protein [Candidatus Bathyarchaeota archaeon]